MSTRRPAKGRSSQTRRDALQGMSQAQYARGKGVSRQAVRKAIAAGRIPFLRGTRRIDPRAADRAWRENSDPAKRRGAPGGRKDGEDPTLLEARTRREFALAQVAELELAEKRGEMVQRSDVVSSASACSRLTKDRVLAVPASIIDSLEAFGLTDVVSAQRVITEALMRALEGVAGELETVPGDGPAPPPPASEAKAS